MKREPWTEPYTRRERLNIRYDLKRYDVRRFFEAGLWQRLAWMLPRKLALWAFIRVCGNVSDLPPDQITYPVAYDRWERVKRRKPAANPDQSLIEIGAFICLTR